MQIHEVDAENDAAWVEFMIGQSARDALVREWNRQEVRRLCAAKVEQHQRVEIPARIASTCLLLTAVLTLLCAVL